jgi:hypothetical protein
MRLSIETFFAHVLARARSLLSLSLIAVSIAAAIAPVRAAESEYTPTTKDMMSIQGAMDRYHEGLDKHDNKLMASAFTQDGTLALINHGKTMTTVGHDQMAIGGLLGSEPPPPPPGAPPGTPSGAPAVEPGELWHFSDINGHFKFESPTRATHYAYWMDVHVHEESNSSTLGIPGHYEDVFVKRNGQWLFLARKVFVGTK